MFVVAMPVIVRSAGKRLFPAPVFVRVTVSILLVVPTCWRPNPKLKPARLAMGATPWPETGTNCLPEPASELWSSICTKALRRPVALGIKVTEKLQLPPTGTVPIVEQSGVVDGATTLKSPGLALTETALHGVNGAPAIQISSITKSTSPKLVSVMSDDFTLVVPTSCSPNATLGGLICTATAVPTPDTVRDWAMAKGPLSTEI